MKSFIATASMVGLLASSAVALPTVTKRDNVADVVSNIDAWQTDIANVNTFLDQAASELANTGSTFDFASQAQNIIGNGAGQGPPGTASDEPTRLMALTALLDPADGNAMAASTELGNIFGGVLGNLTNIIMSNNDPSTVQTAVNAINDLRCNHVLPDISELWNGVVTDNPGAPLPPPVTTGPMVCPVITTATLPF